MNEGQHDKIAPSPGPLVEVFKNRQEAAGVAEQAHRPWAGSVLHSLSKA